MEEIEDLFGGFQKSNRRSRLFAKLVEYVAALRNAGLLGQLIVDGSFVMGSVDEPEDIDLILVLPVDWDFAAELRPFQYNLISTRDIKRRYPFDVFTVRASSPEEARWIGFFSKVGVKWYESCDLPDGRRKGLVRIAL